MEIQVASGVGTGNTTLSAFDRALKEAGVYNYNLVYLSSIVPPGSKVKKIKRYQTAEEDFGKKLYVVKAEIRSEKTGKFIAAGLGWYQLEDGRGVFVEHTDMAQTEIAVKSEIKKKILLSLSDLCRSRDFEFEEKRANSTVSIAQIKDKPTSVLAVAVYESRKWHS